MEHDKTEPVPAVVRQNLPRHAEAGETRMEAPLTCTACGNHCLSPPSSERDYACPRCGRLLPRGHRRVGPRQWQWAGPGIGAQLRYFLLLASLFGAVTMGVKG